RIEGERRSDVAKLLDAGDRTDRGAFAGIEQPRPQANGKVTLPTRGVSDQLQHRLGHHVKHQQRAGEPFGDPRDQVVNLISLKVWEQTLRSDEDRVGWLQPV